MTTSTNCSNFFDSFLGVGNSAQGVVENYDQVDRDWQAFNRTFIVVYEPQRGGSLAQHCR